MAFLLFVILLAVCVAAAMGVTHLYLRLQAAEIKHQEFEAQFAGVIDATKEERRLRMEIEASRRRYEEEKRHIEARVTEARRVMRDLSDTAVLAQVAFYEPRYHFATSGMFAAQLDSIQRTQARLIKEHRAVVVSGPVDRTNKREIRSLAKLMLRAFNGEADAATAKVSYKNIATMEHRVNRAFTAINMFGASRQVKIHSDYRDLRIQELHLVHGYQEKLQLEREEQRAIKEQMRDEELARREIERAKSKAEAEEHQYEIALQAARAEAAAASNHRADALNRQIQELEQRLAEAHLAKERAISRAQQTRAGHVYVISNVGAFGEGVFKVGLTRRLVPEDRVWELSDASVPFDFDIHAMIYSNDAPKLESALHSLLAPHRINRINLRKEFFRVELATIEDAVRNSHGTATFTRAAEAKEWRQTVAIIEGRVNELTEPTAVRGDIGADPDEAVFGDEDEAELNGDRELIASEGQQAARASQ